MWIYTFELLLFVFYQYCRTGSGDSQHCQYQVQQRIRFFAGIPPEPFRVRKTAGKLDMKHTLCVSIHRIFPNERAKTSYANADCQKSIP